MIVLNLCCGNRHQFEGWFASTEEFSRQAEILLVACPHCSDVRITRLPSGPHIKRTGISEPADINAALSALAALVKDSENVGAKFPEEARKIHYEEIPPRSIRGIASITEVKALIEEGIAVLPLPTPSKDEMH